MSNKPVHIVFTTIFKPDVLTELQTNLSRYNHLDQVKIWVVGDRKTPPEAAQLSAQVSAQGLETEYLDIEAQDKWGQRVAEFYNRIPYNNETRRNIGYLCALEAGCETLLAIDDDNFPTDDDYLAGHLRTGQQWSQPLTSESTGFHNICEYLTFEPSRPIFPRGFPFNLRGSINAPQQVTSQQPATIGVTAGLWLKEPDIDATTWINGKVTSTAYTGPETVVLTQDTWTPINTQNTSVVRELVPAFLCVPMGFDVPGGKIQRYGDIWGGYFLQAIMKDTPYFVSFGQPLVEHRRNPHNYVDDLRHEFWGMILTDWLLQLLREEFHPTSSSIVDRVDELANFLRESAAEKLPAWAPESVKEFILWTAENLRTWGAACRVFVQ
jgi:hypothetical protein